MENKCLNTCHNPYFNRWFSAIPASVDLRLDKVRHNPYFNRWFSAIKEKGGKNIETWNCHNPYFNGWFSAMTVTPEEVENLYKSQSLF